MSHDTADSAIAAAANELVVTAGSTALGPGERAVDGVAETAGALADGLGRVRGDTERMAAARDVWRALWSSRLLVWASGVATVVAFGLGPLRHAFDPPGIMRGFGRLGDILAAPAARWDAAWYLVIAHYGYRPDLGAFTASRSAFFPLYPLSVSGVERLGAQPVLAGVLVSVVALAVALYGLHRLTTLEVTRLRRSRRGGLYGGRYGAGGRFRASNTVDASEVARLVVMLTVFAPMAFYFSAVYSESLYLAVSVWVFLCARRGRWGLVAVLGALASATRNTGVLLIAPAALLYLYGPREDRDADHRPVEGQRAKGDLRSDHARGERRHWAPAGGVGLLARSGLLTVLEALRPRYRLRRDALWLLLIPIGLGLYMAHLAIAGGDALAPFHAQAVWERHFAGPFVGLWDGAKAAFEGARQLLSMQRTHVYFSAAGGSPFIDAGHNLMLFAFLAAAVPAIVGVVRLLPFAYGAYVLVALALPLSYPVAPQPLMSLPRFLLVLFPLNMWLAVRLVEHPRARAVALGLSSVALMLFTAEFATWHWVA